MHPWHQLRPTPDQYQAFGDYLPEAHSWYKHLPLLSGRRFVVFVAPDAGIGRLVARLHAGGYTLETPAEGPEFTDANPRVHYGWTTTKEYRSRFGHLDYMRRDTPAEPYARDAGPAVSLPAPIEEQCGFVLYPYVSWTFAEALTWDVHTEALAALAAGAAHPARAEVLELARLAVAQETAWANLDRREQEWLLARDDHDAPPLPAGPSPSLQVHLDCERQSDAISTALRERETAKIWRALAALDHWIEHAGAQP